MVAGECLSDREQLLYDIGGLGSTYTSLVITIPNKKRVLGLDEVFTWVRTPERQLTHMNKPNPDFQVNYSKTTSNPSQLFRGSQSSPNVVNFSQTQCQICKKMGHIASKCYFRYTQSKNNGSNNNNSKPKESDSSKKHHAHFSTFND